MPPTGPPPPPPPPSSGGSSGSKKKKKGRTTQTTPSSSPQHNPWVVVENGHISYVNSIKPPANALTSFGLPIKRSDYLQAASHYNDLFRAWVGRKAKPSEISRILEHGVSDFSLQMHFTHLPGFKNSAVYRSYKSQANTILGFNYKLNPQIVRQTLLGQGDLHAALANSRQVQRAVTRSFVHTGGAQAQYLSGAFGVGHLDNRQLRALALNESGLVKNNLGIRLENALQQAQARMQRIFGGQQLATPSLSLSSGGLSAPSLLGQQQPDVPAG